MQQDLLCADLCHCDELADNLQPLKQCQSGLLHGLPKRCVDDRLVPPWMDVALLGASPTCSWFCNFKYRSMRTRKSDDAGDELLLILSPCRNTTLRRARSSERAQTRPPDIFIWVRTWSMLARRRAALSNLPGRLQPAIIFSSGRRAQQGVLLPNLSIDLTRTVINMLYPLRQ